jgi:hypothetical protein
MRDEAATPLDAKKYPQMTRTTTFSLIDLASMYE